MALRNLCGEKKMLRSLVSGDRELFWKTTTFWFKSFNLIVFSNLIAQWRGNSVQMFFFPLKFIFIYLFLAALGLCPCICSEWQLVFVAWIFPYGGFSCCGAKALGLRTQQLLRVGSVVVAPGLSCSAACGIFPTKNQTHVPRIGRWILNH